MSDKTAIGIERFATRDGVLKLVMAYGAAHDAEPGVPHVVEYLYVRQALDLLLEKVAARPGVPLPGDLGDQEGPK